MIFIVARFLDKCFSSVGYEYELILREKLQNRGIPFLGKNGKKVIFFSFLASLIPLYYNVILKIMFFEGEDDMRSRGYDKTPDCKLEIPIGI